MLDLQKKFGPLKGKYFNFFMQKLSPKIFHACDFFKILLKMLTVNEFKMEKYF